MRRRDRRALSLVALQTADLIWTRLSPRYGDELRSIVGGALVVYYSAAVTFHVLASDSPDAAVPAAACAALACSVV